jgi:hypothetical protein
METDLPFELLIESLRVVAAPAELQSRMYPAFACPAVEVSTTFGEAYLFTPQLVRKGLISIDAQDRLLELDNWFATLPTMDDSIISNESLRLHPFWEHARLIAIEVLKILDQEVRAPKEAGNM